MTEQVTLAEHVREEARRTLAAYRAQPNLVLEHVGIEDEVLSGGYGHRQIHELVQNGADAIYEGFTSGRIHFVLTADALYCANEGAPLDTSGIDAILNSHMSRKRGAQIGQFGLGFKSVLAVSTCPELHSKDVSFAFDAEWSANELRRELPTAERTPVLRLARVLDPSIIRIDAELSSLLQWATTVVKLPRNVDRTEWISQDFDSFPREFLLFSPHVHLLTLEDRVTDRLRRISVRHSNSRVVVSEGDDGTEWSVFAREVAVTDLSADAQRDADRKTRSRAALPVIWAVPHDGKRVRGQFWAFFPTETETSLTGILNAPWKTNADRQNLLDGPFNRALLDQVVNLIQESLPTLLRDDDPGYLLDVLPARAADAAGWADKALIESLEPRLSSVDCVPDAEGKLRRPDVLLVRPAVAITASVSDPTVLSAGDRPDLWVHASVEKRERRAKALRFGVKEANTQHWLEMLAEPRSPGSSVRAIFMAGIVKKYLSPLDADALHHAKIILTEADALVSALHPMLVLSHWPEGASADSVAVHQTVAGDTAARAVLLSLNVLEDNAVSHLFLALTVYPVNWTRAWSLLRELTVAEALKVLSVIVDKNKQVHVKTLDGRFRSIHKTLLPGAIVPLTGERDVEVGVDLAFHNADIALLRALGATEVPHGGRDEQQSEWYANYLQVARADYLAELPISSSRPSWGYLTFANRQTVGPLDPFTGLSVEGRLQLTNALLAYLSSEQPWTRRHQTRPTAYPTRDFEPPVRWMVRREGRLSTSLGVTPVADAIGPTLAGWDRIIPVAAIDPAAAAALQLPASLDALTLAQWASAFAQIQHVPDERLVGNFYRAAAEVVEAPDLLWCQEGDNAVARPPSLVHVASNADSMRAHRVAGIPSVFASNRKSALLLIARWGLHGSAGTVRYVASTDESPLADVVPGLRRYLPETAWLTPMIACDSVWIELAGSEATSVTPLQFARVGEALCFVSTVSEVDLLSHTAAEFGIQLSSNELRDAQDYARRLARSSVVAEVAGIEDLAAKLGALIGGRALAAGLPPLVLESLADRGGDQSPLVLAQTALAVHGVDVLRQYVDVLSEKGLEPPTRWNGSARALEFVDELGFPAEYAGFKRSRLDPTIDVDGPIVLKPLHEFQATIVNRIQAFLKKAAPERGLVSLPTGSGKTRVVVQAIVESMARGEFDGTLVWIAQSEELCEQAVQAWRQVWKVFGSGRRLRISRLWGTTNNRIVTADAPHVVVCTYQSLVSRLRLPAYRWLLDSSCVIIDEAHGSIAPSYTEILDIFGLTARTTARPLIGLTATPFRSAADPAETQWLVNRYGQQRFDHDVISGHDPYAVLQDMGVLARVDQEVIEGSELTLSATELAELVQFKRLPASAEARLGESGPRNSRLVESIKALPEDWPVLLFATSVDQAHLLAALLSMAGISAKAISGATDRGARRHYIEEFRQGRIRVLSNYNVLSTGFDAPALRALYIARPVYSPVFYQQMLGRGLRGPLNGGKERCLVVNVQDNIAQFGDQLAFRHFEYLWRREQA